MHTASHYTSKAFATSIYAQCMHIWTSNFNTTNLIQVYFYARKKGSMHPLHATEKFKATQQNIVTPHNK